MENRMDTVSLPDSEHKRDFTLCVAGPGGLVGVTLEILTTKNFQKLHRVNPKALTVSD